MMKSIKSIRTTQKGTRMRFFHIPCWLAMLATEVVGSGCPVERGVDEVVGAQDGLEIFKLLSRNA